MGKYIKWDDVTNRYRMVGNGLDATQVGSSFIPYAESFIEGKLAKKFTVPFSDNNLTVKDLCIDVVYIKAGNLKLEESKELKKDINDRIAALLDEEEFMITTSGDIITASIDGTVWSNTQNYHGTFGVGETLDFTVDSSWVTDEEDERL